MVFPTNYLAGQGSAWDGQMLNAVSMGKTEVSLHFPRCSTLESPMKPPWAGFHQNHDEVHVICNTLQ
jgi:hypothetical protein